MHGRVGTHGPRSLLIPQPPTKRALALIFSFCPSLTSWHLQGPLFSPGVSLIIPPCYYSWVDDKVVIAQFGA